MRWHMNLRVALLWTVAMLVSSVATAAAYRWEEITLPVASGATCGNGTPYRFYVNRAPAPNDRNLLIAYEFGGACTDYGSCTGEGGAISAKNPDGIPAGYLWSIPAQGRRPRRQRDPQLRFSRRCAHIAAALRGAGQYACCIGLDEQQRTGQARQNACVGPERRRLRRHGQLRLPAQCAAAPAERTTG